MFERIAAIETLSMDGDVNVEIIPHTGAAPVGKLADAELHFVGGALAGLKLVGFGVWESRGRGRHVTFPARPSQTDGARRPFALLRDASDRTASARLRQRILETFAGVSADTSREGQPSPVDRR